MAMFKYRQFLNETEDTTNHDVIISPPQQFSDASTAVVVLPPTLKLPCPDDYRKRSIIASIICLPIGLMALRWSIKVHRRHDDNNKAGAMRAQGEAAAWGLIGIAIGVFFWIVVLIVVIVEVVLVL